MAADGELPQYLLRNITPVRPCLLLRWDHAQEGCSAFVPFCVPVDARLWCWGE